MGTRKTMVGGAALLLVAGTALALSPRGQFLVGGALVNVGYRMQDHLSAFDMEHRVDITPEQVWQEFVRHNELSSTVREWFPRATYHPLMALLVCMDARIDTNELVGDTRRNYYVVRTAGSVMGPAEEDMLELAVANGVKVVVLTRHTDCAAERAAADPAQRARFPELVAAVDEREQRVREFLARPVIAERIADGRLLVKQHVIDTKTEQLLPGAVPPPVAPAGEHGSGTPAGHGDSQGH